MKSVRALAFVSLMMGLLFISGTSTPQAAGQVPAPPGGAPASGFQGASPTATPAIVGTPFDPRMMGSYYLTQQGGIVGYRSESAELARKYSKATKEDDKKELRKKLAAVLEKEFEQHAQHQQTQIDELEKQLANLKATLKKRKESKEPIVDRRLEQLIQEAEGLGWGSSDRFINPAPARPSTAVPAP